MFGAPTDSVPPRILWRAVETKCGAHYTRCPTSLLSERLPLHKTGNLSTPSRAKGPTTIAKQLLFGRRMARSLRQLLIEYGIRNQTLKRTSNMWATLLEGF